MLKNNLQDAQGGECYPCTIIMDRYTGAYSGAIWLAFNLYSYDVPKEIEADDGSCHRYWNTHDHLVTPIGKGDTPQEAYDDLLKNIITYCKHHLNS